MNPVLIREERLGEFHDAAEKLTKRARRHGLMEPLFRIGPIPCMVWETFQDWDGEKRAFLEPYRAVFVDAGEPIQVAGFEFIARLERVGDDHIVHIVPGKEAVIEQRFHAASNKCEHCNTARRRVDTYVVREVATGRQLQVGKNCLRDFLGCDTPEKLAARFQFARLASDMAGDYYGLGSGPRTITTSTFMAAVACVVRIRGYISRATVQRLHAQAEAGLYQGPVPSSTRSMVHDVIFPSIDDKEAQRFSKMIKASINDDDRAQAAKVLDFWSTRNWGDDFERNLNVILKQDFVAEKHFGYAVAALPSWARIAKVELGPPKPKSTSEFQGKVGERIEREVTITNKHGIETQFGYSTIVKMVDAEGNTYTWFASNSAAFALGAKVQLVGTVKGHTTYKDVKETQLSRCKVAKGKAR